MEYSAELLAAVAVLDKDQPGWWRKIDLGRFTLVGCKLCVIGQVYGSVVGTYSATVNRLGFLATNRPAPCRVFAQLCFEPEWRSLIAERNEADRIGETTPAPERTEFIEGVLV